MDRNSRDPEKLFSVFLCVLCVSVVKLVKNRPQFFHSRPLLGRSVGDVRALAIVVFISAASCFGQPKEFSPDFQTRLARQFAPVLVFHSLEKYFPCSPLFPLEGDASAGGLKTATDLLGTAQARSARYELLGMKEKAALAKVYYRAYPSGRGNQQTVVLEYWLYYVSNVYRIQGGGLFPFWLDASHPNDLEHIKLLLVPRSYAAAEILVGSPGHQYEIRIAATSAHAGFAPPNVHRFSPEQKASDPLRFLVELGSHATAPDVDQDGMFRPGLDANLTYKLVWGIRDQGRSWAKYNPAYMDSRGEKNAILFVSPESLASRSEAQVQTDRFPYQLVHVDELDDGFSRLGFSHSQLVAAFETSVGWPKKLFGKSDGNAERLLIPPDSTSRNGFKDGKFLPRADSEIMIGGTSLISHTGVFLGGRHAIPNSSKYIPDLALEAAAIVTSEGDDFYGVEFLGFYPLDAMTRFFGGIGLVTDSPKFSRRQWDWVAGVEVNLGHIRIHNAFRRRGRITHSYFDLRLSYVF